MTLVLGHPDVPISADYVSKLLKVNVISAMLTPPSILEELSKDRAGIAMLANLKRIGYAGGPLQPSVSSSASLKLTKSVTFGRLVTRLRH
jgi:hypothetical protein